MLKILDDACTPKRGTKYSAYVDLFAREDVVVGAGDTKIVPLGVKLDLEKLYQKWFIYTEQNKINESWSFFLSSHYLEIALRSSLGVKGLVIANGKGVVDLDYEGEIGLIVHNPITAIDAYVENIDGDVWSDYVGAGADNSFKIKKGDKVCQCTLKEHKSYLMGYESDNIRSGGYGSTNNE